MGMASCKSRKSPWEKSWAVPLVTGYTYQIGWGGSQLDWTHLGIEIDTFEEDDWVILEFLFGDVREHFQVRRGTDPDDTD